MVKVGALLEVSYLYPLHMTIKQRHVWGPPHLFAFKKRFSPDNFFNHSFFCVWVVTHNATCDFLSTKNMTFVSKNDIILCIVICQSIYVI